MQLRRIGRSGPLLAAGAALFLALGSPLSAQVDMTGTWSLEVDVAGAVSNPSLVLQQTGMAITGHYTSEQLGEADVTGTVDGSMVTVTFDGDLGGQSFTVTYSGTVDGDGVWSGTFDLSGLADGTFRGTKESQ